MVVRGCLSSVLVVLGSFIFRRVYGCAEFGGQSEIVAFAEFDERGGDGVYGSNLICERQSVRCVTVEVRACEERKRSEGVL